MTQNKVEFETLLIYHPLAPASVVDDLRRIFPTVLYYPVQPSKAATEDTQLPSDEDYARADAIFSFILPPNLKDFKQTPRLKLFQGLSAGYSHIEESEFYKTIPEDSEVTFANASGIHVSTIGEHVLGTVLMLYHKLHTMNYVLRSEQRWMSHEELGGNFIRELNTLKVGILGYGHIGRETARLFHSCGSTIYATTRNGKPSPESGFILPHTGDPSGSLPDKYFSSSSRDSLLAFFSECDVVVNTLPDSAATRGFIGEEELKAMKGDAVYVNIGRGTTTDQEKLIKALQAEPKEGEEKDATGTLRIGGASLDVTTPEPLPQGHTLFQLPNVVLTPHMSGLSTRYYVNAAKVLETNVDRLKRGKGALNAYRGKGERD
ncbi:hypothetical protein JCM10213_008321 [Rhodosporidiobolus nylandii]